MFIFLNLFFEIITGMHESVDGGEHLGDMVFLVAGIGQLFKNHKKHAETYVIVQTNQVQTFFDFCFLVRTYLSHETRPGQPGGVLSRIVVSGGGLAT